MSRAYGVSPHALRRPRRAVRDTVVYGRIVSDAHRAGTLNPQGDHPPVPPSFREDAARLRELMPDVPDDMIVRGLIAWTGLFGRLSFELFGQFDNATLDRATAFDHTMRCHARTLGLPV